MSERAWHYVRGNEITRLPRKHIFLDTEAHSERTKTGHDQSWRLAVACYRDAPKGRAPKERWETYSDPAALWADVAAFTRARNRTVLWAHNLGYDVRVTDMFRTLPALGWSLEAHNLANRGTWFQWRRDGASLTMVDSASVFPVPLSRLAPCFALAKEELPGQDDSRERWMARCTRDVQILRDGVCAYLAWLEAEDLGNWQLTGAGQSYSAFRHRHLTHKMLVHCDVDALVAERRAMWTGRCEAYWHGKTRLSGVEEWDLALAYARVAAMEHVPTRLLGMAPPGADLGGLLTRSRTAVLAQVDVQTDVPILPTIMDGRMMWPTGRFTTTVWSPEITLALDSGAKLHCRRAWIYRADPALAQWAHWIISQLEDPNANTPAWLRIVLKHWARALIGRFGMSYTKWATLGRTQDLAVRMSTVYDLRDDTTWQFSHVGDRVHRSDGAVEWDQSQPAVTGHIMSACRARLWRLIAAMPARSVLYVDTDSLLIPAEFHDEAAALAATPLGEGLRLKSTWPSATIFGPRQIITGDVVRMAGVPRKARRLPDGTIVGETWQSLMASLRRGRPATVMVTDRTFRARGVDRRRVATASGWTDPIRVEEEVSV